MSENIAGFSTASAVDAGRASRLEDAENRLPDPLRPWLVSAFGDERDEVRAALSAGSDATDDLAALRYILEAAADEESLLGPEERQRALQSAIRLLRERADILRNAFDYLWLASTKIKTG